MIPVAILCGGKGTRLAPLTDHLPKSLIDVNGKPFILHQFDLLKKNGYTDIVLLTGHLGHLIENRLGDGRGYGMSIRYSRDGDTPLGHDCAIEKALQMLGPEFMVLYGDAYLDCEYRILENVLRDNPSVEGVLTLWGDIDYGIRAFRAFPPKYTETIQMLKSWEEIGSFEGLERVRAITR